MDGKHYSAPLELGRIQITDGFWGREQELVRKEVIPYQWEALNDRIPEAAPSYCMRNFKVAGKLMRRKKEKGTDFVPPSYTFRGFQALPEDPDHPDPDQFYGFVFQDSDFSKWIEAVGYSLANHPDPELEKTADEAIDLVCAAQAEDGYLDTYYIINGMDRIFTNLRDHHELYCFGHLAEGAVAYYQATGKDKLLKAAERYAAFIARKFGPGEDQLKGYPGHEIAEMALARLYEATGEKQYLDLAAFFLDMRGRQPYYFDLEEKERAAYEGRPYREPEAGLRHFYHQAHLPVREQTEAVGHAVRAVYLYSGMADVARLHHDQTLYDACQKIWDNIVKEKLYVTGGIGATHLGEAFSFSYDLPNDTAYSETCAAIGLAFFARRMLEIQAVGEYGDVMELALYNTVLAGMALDGKSFFYVNPLEVFPEACQKDERKFHVKSVRQKWFGCACCPPNIARIISSLGAYVCTVGSDTLYTHLYVGNTAGCRLNGKELKLKTESEFPWEGRVRVTLSTDEPIPGTLAFRIPGWCREAKIRVSTARGAASWRVTDGPEGKTLCGLETEGDGPVQARLEKGYLYLTGEWENADQIRLEFPMEVRMLGANWKVREDAGRVSFARGPVCYCLEEADNGKDLHLLKADKERLLDPGTGALNPSAVAVETYRGLGHEMRVLKAPGIRIVPSGEDALYGDYRIPDTRPVTLTLVPYYAWNNRGEGEMQVWTRI